MPPTVVSVILLPLSDEAVALRLLSTAQKTADSDAPLESTIPVAERFVGTNGTPVSSTGMAALSRHWRREIEKHVIASHDGSYQSSLAALRVVDSGTCCRSSRREIELTPPLPFPSRTPLQTTTRACAGPSDARDCGRASEALQSLPAS